MDDEEPPPLSSLAEQVNAVKLRSTRLPAAAAAAAVTEPVESPASEGPASQGTPDATKPKAKAKEEKKDDEIIEIKCNKQKGLGGGGPNIPDFMRLPPDEQEKKYAEMKSKLQDALKPTPDMINQIGQNPDLLSAFDDPEVMAAVNDVAKTPANLKKYANNPKVTKFYEKMGMMMGS
eukprot:gene14080-20030_t